MTSMARSRSATRRLSRWFSSSSFLQTPHIRDLHPAVLLLPAVESLLADSVLAAHRRRRQAAGLSLPKDPDDLLFLEPGFAHRISSAREILSQWLVRNSESVSPVQNHPTRSPMAI